MKNLVLSREAFRVSHRELGVVTADYLNANTDFLYAMNEYAHQDVAVGLRVMITRGGMEYDATYLEDYGAAGFDSSWLQVKHDSSQGESSPITSWLKDCLREPRGPYIVYQVAVVHSGLSDNKDPFRYKRPDIPSVFEAIKEDGSRSYIGITKQSLMKRWSQHINEAQRDRRYLFHRFLGKQFDMRGGDTRAYVRVLRTGLDFDEAMQAEEDLVAKSTIYPRGLNMIPGGFAGLRFLAERNFHTNAKRINKSRAAELAQFFNGRPDNPLLALRLQSDDELISRIVCNNPRNFDITEVRQIRAMSELGHSEAQIAEEVKANQQRIHNLLTDRTYSRVA